MNLLILYAALTIALSFLCSILEAVLLSVNSTFLKIKIKEGFKFAINLERLKKNIDEPLIIILTLNTIAHTVGAILVGLPLNNDKSLNKISQFIVDISKNMDLYLIENKINLPIFFWDENFSSFEAETLVRDFYKGKKIDKFAAKIFLDDFIRENTLLDEKEN